MHTLKYQTHMGLNICHVVMTLLKFWTPIFEWHMESRLVMDTNLMIHVNYNEIGLCAQKN